MMEKEKTIECTTYIWGAARYGEYALEYCRDRFNIVGFIDRRAGIEFHELCSKPIKTPTEFCSEAKERINVIIAVTYPAEVIEFIETNDLRQKIAAIYIFDGRNKDMPLLYKVEDGEICVPEYMDKRFAELNEYSEHYSKWSPYIVKMFYNAIFSVYEGGENR